MKLNITEEQDTVEFLELVAGQGVVRSNSPVCSGGDHDVEIVPRYSFISAGTELGGLRKFRETEPAGLGNHRLGYSQSGIVSRVGSAVEGIREGDRVVAIGAGAHHASRTVVAKNLVLPLPASVELDVASMMAMFCFALEGVYKARPCIGENAVVLGAGMMGQLSARFLQLAGCNVFAMDTNENRVQYLPSGVEGFSCSETRWKALAERLKPHGAEIAAICFGGDATESVERVKSIMGVSPDGVAHGRVVFPGGAHFTVLMASNMGNIQFISSSKAGPGYRDPEYEAGGNYPSSYVPRTVRRNMETILSLLADGRLHGLEHLISHRFAFADADRAYKLLLEPNTKAMGVVLDYWG